MGNGENMIAEAMLAVSLLGAPPTQPREPFFAEDKFKHYFASFVITSLAASGARVAGLKHSESIAVGAGFGAAGGLIKEIQDERRGQFFSVRDMLWDLAGIGTAVVVVDAAR
jgi:uncharacterized protein YfiM (DUF2279 family)